MHKAFGYRFVIDEFKYPVSINANETIDVSFTLRNTGSSPFYTKWPVELSLLNAKTKRVVSSFNYTTRSIKKSHKAKIIVGVASSAGALLCF